MSGDGKEGVWGPSASTFAGFAIVAVVIIGLLYAVDSSTYEFSWDAALAWYLIGGFVVGGLASILLFFGAWYFAADQFGAAGYLFGWIPGGVLAFVGGALLVPLWGVVLVGFVIAYNN